MSIIPDRINWLLHQQELYQFLVTCQHNFTAQDSERIISFSQALNPLDPLAFCQAASPTKNQSYFYLENPRKKQAIAAVGITKSTTIDSPNRFLKSRKFVQSCLQKNICTGDLQLPGSGPYFFCNFTFFDSPENSDHLFPSATIFLPIFYVYISKKCCVLVANFIVDFKRDIELTFQEIQQQFKAIRNATRSSINLTFIPPEQLIRKASDHLSNYQTSVI